MSEQPNPLPKSYESPLIGIEELGQIIPTILNAPEILNTCQRTLAGIQALLGNVRVQIFLIDRQHKRINFEFDTGRVIGLLETNYKAWNNSLNGVAYRTGQNVLLNAERDTQTLPDENIMLLQDTSQVSQIIVGLNTPNACLGTITITRDSEQPRFRLNDVPGIVTIASLTAVAIENHQLHQIEQKRRQVTEKLLQAGRQLSGAMKLAEVPTHILAQLAAVVPFERGSLMLQEKDTLRIVAQKGFPEDERVKQLRVSIREGDVYNQVADGGTPIIIDDVTQISGWQQVSWLPLNRSWIGVPLFSRDKVIGMISLTRRESGAFSLDDSLLTSTFALQAATALENAELYEEVTRFTEQLEEMVQQRTDELEKAMIVLERMDRHKSDFISVAAHELRTPLTIMLGYTSMLEADALIRSQAHLLESIRGVLTGTERLHEIVNSMLDVVRIESQVLSPHAEPVSLAAVIRRIYLDAEEDLEKRSIQFEQHELNTLPRVRGDSSLLLKVFHNVLYNAIKFTPDGGKITISGQEVVDQVLGNCVEILVQDTGIGIDRENQELIFEKFYQTGEVALHSSGKTTFKGGGPGLGLAIARGIVDAHKGRIWAESKGCDEKNCPGSKFYILLPIA